MLQRVRDLLVADGGVPFDHGRDIEAFYARTVPALAERGFFGMLIPEEYGGWGLTLTEYCEAIAVIGARDAMSGYSINEHSTIGSLGLVQHGSDSQRAAWLPKLASGDILAAFCLTEPRSGTDITRLATVAEPSGNSHYILDGKKIHISLAWNAGLYTVLAEIPGEEGHRLKTAFLVERERPGLSFGPENSSPPGFLIPVAGSVELTGCEVERGSILGEIGRGGGIFKAALEAARVGLAAVYVGASEDALRRCVDRLRNRTSFGKALTDHQGIQNQLADMKIELEASRHIVLSAARKVDREPEHATGLAAAAKVFATESARSIGATAIQLFGGYAFLSDPPVYWYMNDAKMGEILGGTSEVMRMLVFKDLMREASSAEQGS